MFKQNGLIFSCIGNNIKKSLNFTSSSFCIYNNNYNNNRNYSSIIDRRKLNNNKSSLTNNNNYNYILISNYYNGKDDRKSSVERATEKLLNKIDPSSITSETGQRLPSAKRSKLNKGLDKTEKVVISECNKGIMDQSGNEIAEIINETLASRSFYKIFKGCDDASKVVEIEEVKINRDCSHAYAYWSSDILNKFAETMVLDNKINQEDYNRFVTKSVKYIHSHLQIREGFFRSKLAQKMSFKRVPKIYFKPMYPDLNPNKKETDMRQQVLRESLGNEENLTGIKNNNIIINDCNDIYNDVKDESA
jgi:ribosome-binding factor A